MSYKKRVQTWLKHQLHFSIAEIALAGLIVCLMCINALPIFSFNLVVMRVGITMVWPILLGLTLRLPLGLLCAIIGDQLILLIRGGIGQWMIEYAIIFPLITGLSFSLKAVVKSEHPRIFLALALTINLLVGVGVVVTLALFQNFKTKAINEETGIDFTTPVALGVVYGMLALMLLTSLAGAIITVLTYQQKIQRFSYAKVRLYYGIYLIVALVIVVFIWAYGPIAYIRYLNTFVNPDKDYYAVYELYLVPRILKTVVILPLYTAIVAPLFYASELVNKKAPAKWTH